MATTVRRPAYPLDDAGSSEAWAGLPGELETSITTMLSREVTPEQWGAIGDAASHPIGAAPFGGVYADIWAMRAALPTKYTSLADAAATSFVPWTAAGTALVVLGADWARITYSTAANTLTIDSQSAGAVFAAATGVLGGTSGAAGKVSLSVAGGLFYVENRRGSTQAPSFSDVQTTDETDWVALQLALNSQHKIVLRSAHYMINRPLLMGRDAIYSQAVWYGQGIEGQGPGQTAAGVYWGGGSCIEYTGAAGSAPGVILVGREVWQGLRLKGFALLCTNYDGAAAGVKFTTAKFTGILVKDLYILNTTYAFEIKNDTSDVSGQNGEWSMFEFVRVAAVVGLLKSDAGQALSMKFHNCHGYMRGAVFSPAPARLALLLFYGATPGFEIQLDNTAFTCADDVSYEKTVLDFTGATAAGGYYAISGGRFEKWSTLVKSSDNYGGRQITVVYRDLEMAGMQCTAAWPAVWLTSGAAGAALGLNFLCDHVTFSAANNRQQAFFVDVSKGFTGTVLFDVCSFMALDHISDRWHNSSGLLEYRNCLAVQDIAAGAVNTAAYQFSRSYGGSKVTEVPSRNHGGGERASGELENLLLNNKFQGTSGVNIAPPAPWAVRGGGTTILKLEQYPTDSSALGLAAPDGVILAFASNASTGRGIEQVLPTVALNPGAAGVLMHYRARARIWSPNTPLRFALVSSLDEALIFDEAIVQVADKSPFTVVLTRQVNIASGTARPKLIIENMHASNNLFFSILHQGFSTKPRLGLADAAAAAVTGDGQEWTTLQRLAAYGRLRLPTRPSTGTDFKAGELFMDAAGALRVYDGTTLRTVTVT
jgi:hypothetical protein